MGVLKFGGPRAQWDSLDSVTAFCFCCVSAGSNSCFAVCFGPRVASDVVEGLPRACAVACVGTTKGKQRTEFSRLFSALCSVLVPLNLVKSAPEDWHDVGTVPV